jgi:hypothetical protein
MSGTKIVIIVLVLIGLLFVVFVMRGAFRDEPPPPTASQMKGSAKKTRPPGWTKTVKDLFSSLKPHIELKQKIYSTNTEEKIGSDDKQAFRTATFHLLKGTAEIVYDDDTPIESDNPLDEMDDPQKCKLPQDPDPDVTDRNRCSILAMKGGGTLTFSCTNNSACRVEVE